VNRMFRRRAAKIGFALALAGCTDKVVLQDMHTPSDAAVGSDAGPLSETGCDGGIKPIHYEQLSAQVMVLLDRSADMGRQFGSTTREDAAQTALNSEVSAFQARIQFGFIEFPPDPTDFQCPPGTCCQGRVGVDPQAYDAYNMGIAIPCSGDSRGSGCSFTSTDSPSHAALATARDYYRANPTEDDVYILLVTSSEPSCAGDSRGACSEAQKVASDLSSLGIRIIVLSVGYQPDNKNSCLSQISQRGSQNLPDGVQLLYTAMSPNDLTGALDALFNAVKQNACTWSSTPVVPPNLSLVVSIGGEKVPQIEGTGQDGWKLAFFDGTKITLTGTYCTKWLTSPQYFKPDVGYPCSFCGGPNACYPTPWQP